MKIKIEDGEGNAGVRVCVLERYHPDDLEGECGDCHRPIFYRPDPPFLIKFLCMDCAEKHLDGVKEIRVSSKTVQEIKAIMDRGDDL